MSLSKRRASARPSWFRLALRLLWRCLRIVVIALAALGPGAPPPPPPPLRQTEERQADGDPDD